LKRIHTWIIALTVLIFSISSLWAQEQKPQDKSSSQAPSSSPTPMVRPREKAPAKPLTPETLPAKAQRSKKFVLDVVQSAVALPQSDQQDRLRVLSSAISVASPLSPKFAAGLTKEGVRIESELIALGKKPAVSVLSSGSADCKTMADFVQRLYPAAMAAAEQSVIGALAKCPKQTGDLVRTRLDAALAQGVLPPRLVMAAIDTQPAHSAWAQQIFTTLFSSLPSNGDKSAVEAPNFATMFATSAAKMDKDVVRDSGVKLLTWLGKLKESGDRQLAINITVSAMKESLGEEAYLRALEKDVMARQASDLAGAPGESSREVEEAASVLQAMSNSGSDQSETLRKLPASMRARQAAAYGFANGTSGDRKGADGYFDMAFTAADEVWSKRNETTNVAALVEEISEAAAQVDPIAALKRAQGLSDPSAQAIGMIAVARVVLSKDLQ
jgi:hypothetical protein